MTLSSNDLWLTRYSGSKFCPYAILKYLPKPAKKTHPHRRPEQAFLTRRHPIHPFKKVMNSARLLVCNHPSFQEINGKNTVDFRQQN
jgi:hypothetical protein